MDKKHYGMDRHSGTGMKKGDKKNKVLEKVTGVLIKMT